MSDKFSRKSFFKLAGLGALGFSAIPFKSVKAAERLFFLEREKALTSQFSANDRINIGLIGAGSMGQGNIHTALEVPGTTLVAACDLYDSRIERTRELWGNDIFTTTNYREILNRDDVDAVVVATTDHWHEQITSDALKAGKAVYLEKPMVQHIDEGHKLIKVENETGIPLIIGSQRTSSILYEKARDLYKQGEIGELNFVEGYWDRLSAIGAWQYSIPPGASTENVDWKTYRKDLPDIPFNPKHFFRWRNYSDYGTGVPGDLFVHLFSGLHLVTGSKGPNRIMTTGGLRYWKDGRDAADVVLGLYDYPETDEHPAFNLSLRVNFADGSGGGSRIRLVGSEGVIDIGWDRVTLKKSQLSEAPGMTVGDFSAETRSEYEKHYAKLYPETRAQIIEPDELVYRAPNGYNDRYDHFVNFFNAIRNGQPVLQDGTFGLRACGPALLSNTSLNDRRVISWDPSVMRQL